MNSENFRKGELLLMTTENAAEYLGLTKRTLDQWRYENKHLDYLKIGGKVMYKKEVLDDFLNNSKVEVNK